jgi:hypothetical protein
MSLHYDTSPRQRNRADLAIVLVCQVNGTMERLMPISLTRRNR